MNKDLLYSTGNSILYSVITYMGKDLKKNGYMYMYNNHSAINLKPTQHRRLTISQHKIKIKQNSVIIKSSSSFLWYYLEVKLH